jgi:ribosomal protein L12E/L44/L45/RPP1/RPP2
MATINQNDVHEAQWFQNMEVLWGLYDTNRILKFQAEGQGDDVANVLIPIIPLFAILCACFIYKELDKWFRTNFDVTIITDHKIERETRRIEIKRERDIHLKNKELEKKLRDEVLAFGASSDAGSKKDDEAKEKESDESKKEDAEDKKEGEEKEEEKKYFDADGKEIDLDKDGDLPG